jgi:hypothetical protein
MASEEDVPPVIKTMFFIAAMILYAVAGYEAERCVISDFIYILRRTS